MTMESSGNESFSCSTWVTEKTWKEYSELCLNTVFTILLVVLFVLLITIIMCFCVWKRLRSRKRSFMFSEDAATDDGKPPEQQQQQPPAVERSFMRSNDNSAASKPPNSGAYSSVHMSTVYDEIKVDNVLSAPPPPPPPPVPSENVGRSDAHGYSIVRKTNKGSFTQSGTVTSNASKNKLTSNGQESTDQSSEMHLMNAPAVMLNQPSLSHNSATHTESASPMYMNATRVATQPSLHFIAERGDSSERSFTKKSSSQEFVVSGKDDRFFSLSQGEESGYSVPSSHRTQADTTQLLLPAPYEEFCVTPNHDDMAATNDAKSSRLPLEESLYSNINNGNQQPQTSHSRARSERIKRSAGGKEQQRNHHRPGVSDDSAL